MFAFWVTNTAAYKWRAHGWGLLRSKPLCWKDTRTLDSHLDPDDGGPPVLGGQGEEGSGPEEARLAVGEAQLYAARVLQVRSVSRHHWISYEEREEAGQLHCQQQ